MNTLNVLLASLLLLMPGFLGLSIFRYFQGIRVTEAQGTLLWSLLWSGLTLLIVLLVGPTLGFTPAMSFLNLSITEATSTPTLSDILRLSFGASVFASFLGVVLGTLVRQDWARAFISRVTGQVFNPDPWANLLGGAIDEPLVVVRMEDGRRYLGNAVQVSETASGRTIALQNTLMFSSDDVEMDDPKVAGLSGLMVITSKIESVTGIDPALTAQALAQPEVPTDVEEAALVPLEADASPAPAE